VRKFNADGFIGFYSTIPSSELNRTLQNYKKDIEVHVYDSAQIERMLLSNPDLKDVFERFFPHSFREYGKVYHIPYKISDSVVRLFCNVCGKDLLKEREGRIGFADEFTDEYK